MNYIESTFMYEWFDGTKEIVVANFDSTDRSNNLKQYFKQYMKNYKLLAVKTKTVDKNETYPYFIRMSQKLSNPSHTELLFFVV